MTIELIKRAVLHLTRTMEYRVPPQDLRVDLGRMPAQPRSRFRIDSVRRRGSAAQRPGSPASRLP
ncbi:MAG TPA: hypothetical protein VES20_01030, partial [Bryobacteraceae bacterium]|nr:hypothetical protein [Bryobacteraceae bacterium]